MFYANTPITKWSRIQDIKFPMVVQHHLPGNCFTANYHEGRYNLITRQFAYDDSGMARAVLNWLGTVGISNATTVTFDIQHRLLTTSQSREMVMDEMLFAVPTFELNGWLVRIYDHNGVVGAPETVEEYLIPKVEVHDDLELEHQYRCIAELRGVLGFYVHTQDGEVYNLPVRRWLAVKGDYDRRSGTLMVRGIEDPNYIGRFNTKMNRVLEKALQDNPGNLEFQVSYSSLARQIDGRVNMFGLRYDGDCPDTSKDHQLCGVF